MNGQCNCQKRPAVQSCLLIIKENWSLQVGYMLVLLDTTNSHFILILQKHLLFDEIIDGRAGGRHLNYFAWKQEWGYNNSLQIFGGLVHG